MIDSSDVIIQVLDARDPMGTRYTYFNGTVLIIILVLNARDPMGTRYTYFTLDCPCNYPSVRCQGFNGNSVRLLYIKGTVLVISSKL